MVRKGCSPGATVGVCLEARATAAISLAFLRGAKSFLIDVWLNLERHMLGDPRKRRLNAAHLLDLPNLPKPEPRQN